MGAEQNLNCGAPAPLIRQLCRYLSERSPQPMVAVEGMTHVIMYVNPAFARLVGRDGADLLGHRFQEAVPEGESNGCLGLLDRVFQSGNPEHLIEQYHRQLELRPVFWSYYLWPILGPDERPAGVMIQVTDETEAAIFRKQSVAINESLVISATRQHELTEVAEVLKKRLEAAVQAREHFLAVVSHELRNPMAALGTGLELLRLAPKDAALVENTRAMMARQFHQLKGMVDELLDVSRITTGKIELHKERVDLVTLLRDAVEASRPLIDRGGHELTMTLPPDPVVLDADPSRLHQVFLNLLNNAAKYSEPGGQIQLSARRDGGEIVVSIQDTGIGMAADDLRNVFEVFVQVDTAWQRAQGGLGIGLSVVKEFVALHGGRVDAHSDGPGKGSEFIVRLPLAIDSAPMIPPARAGRDNGPRRRILVVDDNRDAAASLAMLLGMEGHEVRTAHGGEEAVEMAEEFRPELVLLDLGMPKVDGYEAARRIRAESWGSEPFLVAVTGWGADEDRRGTHAAGFDRHLVKPVDPDELTAVMAEIASKTV